MISFIPELPSNSIEMCVVELQNPSTLWLVDVINKQLSKKFYELEERLKQVLERGMPQCYNRILNVGDLVAVYDPVSRAWCRAKICDIYQKLAKYVYSVFLVDRGYSITSDNSNIKELPPEASTLQFRCYHVQLYGIIPVSPANIMASPENAELQSWLPEAVSEVKELLGNCETVYFTPKLARSIVYGDLYLKFERGYVQLTNYLCDNKFAVYNTNSFELMMETAPYMSCQEGFCFSNNKEIRSISEYINASHATDDTINSREESGCEETCNDSEQISSEHSKSSKSVQQNDSALPSENKCKGSQRRTSALQQYYEEMRQCDKQSSGGLNLKTNPDKAEGAFKQTPHKRYFPGIGRGEKLQRLQKLSAGKKPGGDTCSQALSDNVTNETVENHLMLIDQLSNMSVTGNKRPGNMEQKFSGRNVLTDSMYDEKKTKIDVNKYLSETYTEKQCVTRQTVHHKKFPVSNGSVFVRPSKLMFLPAGSEMSMLVAKKKKKNERSHPDN